VRHIVSNLSFNERIKHIDDFDYDVIREKMRNNLIHLLLMRTSEQPNNVLTKVFDYDIFNMPICRLEMTNMSYPA